VFKEGNNYLFQHWQLSQIYLMCQGYCPVNVVFFNLRG